MKKIFPFLFCIFFVSCGNPSVIFETEFGNIEAEIFLNKAPLTSKNFLSHIENNHFVNSTFYRSVKLTNQPNNNVKIEVIQGGLDIDENLYQPIIHETTNQTKIKHLNGTLSMARNEPGSATTEFFICIGPQPELDFNGKRNPDGFGFSAFGKVYRGMEVVNSIHTQPDSSQRIKSPVKIRKIYIKQNFLWEIK